jgi:predicted ATPase
VVDNKIEHGVEKMNRGFSRLYVTGYRRLRAVDGLALKPMNVLIGANGVGKSSVLEVMDLLAASAQGVLENTISESGGISSLLTLDERTTSMSFALEMPIEREAPIEYQIKIARRGTGYAVSFEQLTQRQNPKAVTPFKFIDATGASVRYHNQKKLLEPNWDYKLFESALSQVPKMYQKPEKFRQILASSTQIYHTLDVSVRAPVRLPQQMQPSDTPGSNGENLLSCLYTMRETQRHRFEAVEDALRSAFPTFDRIDLPAAAAGSLTLAWRDRNFAQPVFPHQLSEGTLRFLWLVALLQSPGLPQVTLIDEPEVSLHPEMLRLLAELMREASQRTQLIVATHSDRFVRFLDPAELLVCDLDEHGGTIIRRASDFDLDAWMAEYALDELWRMGRLGGRAVAGQ